MKSASGGNTKLYKTCDPVRCLCIAQKTRIFLCVFFGIIAPAVAELTPDQILVIANRTNPDSVGIAEYYCQKRAVPKQNILKLSLCQPLADSISRAEYERLVSSPVYSKLSSPEFAGKINCLLTVYGVPFKVGPRGVLKTEEENLIILQNLAQQKGERLREVASQLQSLNVSGQKSSIDSTRQQSIKEVLKSLASYTQNAFVKVEAIEDSLARQQYLKICLRLIAELYGKDKLWQKYQAKANLSFPLTIDEKIRRQDCEMLFKQAKTQSWDFARKIKRQFYASIETYAGLEGLLLRLNSDINNIKGIETNASVDSELSMVMFNSYDLYRWQPNELKKRTLWTGAKTLMVSRLDGPCIDIITGLIDKTISAEQNGLKGTAYIDSGYSQKKSASLYTHYDQSLQQVAEIIRKKTRMKVIEEKTSRLFAINQCPDTAIYFGWYSLRKYIDSFDFVDGAIGYHIASLEATKLRDPTTAQWCPSMLRDGITATLGAVAEPYLEAFPKPKQFFAELIKGKTLVEAFYRTKPFNSWQMILIGDPLYKPFHRIK